jgi:hypothetical protein
MHDCSLTFLLGGLLNAQTLGQTPGLEVNQQPSPLGSEGVRQSEWRTGETSSDEFGII